MTAPRRAHPAYTPFEVKAASGLISNAIFAVLWAALAGAVFYGQISSFPVYASFGVWGTYVLTSAVMVGSGIGWIFPRTSMQVLLTFVAFVSLESGADAVGMDHALSKNALAFVRGLCIGAFLPLIPACLRQGLQPWFRSYDPRRSMKELERPEPFVYEHQE